MVAVSSADVQNRAQLFKGRITLSSGSIHHLTVSICTKFHISPYASKYGHSNNGEVWERTKTVENVQHEAYFGPWMVPYLPDKVIRPLNNRQAAHSPSQPVVRTKFAKFRRNFAQTFSHALRNIREISYGTMAEINGSGSASSGRENHLSSRENRSKLSFRESSRLLFLLTSFETALKWEMKWSEMAPWNGGMKWSEMAPWNGGVRETNVMSTSFMVISPSTDYSHKQERKAMTLRTLLNLNISGLQALCCSCVLIFFVCFHFSTMRIRDSSGSLCAVYYCTWTLRVLKGRGLAAQLAVGAVVSALVWTFCDKKKSTLNRKHCTHGVVTIHPRLLIYSILRAVQHSQYHLWLAAKLPLEGYWCCSATNKATWHKPSKFIHLHLWWLQSARQAFLPHLTTQRIKPRVWTLYLWDSSIDWGRVSAGIVLGNAVLADTGLLPATYRPPDQPRQVHTNRTTTYRPHERHTT